MTWISGTCQPNDNDDDDFDDILERFRELVEERFGQPYDEVDGGKLPTRDTTVYRWPNPII